MATFWIYCALDPRGVLPVISDEATQLDPGKASRLMKKINTLGVVFAAVFLSNIVLAASAFGADEWLINGVALGAAFAALSESAELLFSDTKGGPFGEEIDILCSLHDEGTVGAGGADKITKVTNLAATSAEIKCTTDAGMCTEAVAEAVNLPWTTKIVLAGVTFRDEIGPGTGGGPGYAILCKNIVNTDVCTSPTTKLTSVLLTNAVGGVEASFDAVSEEEPMTCTRGGAGAGLVKGVDLMFVEGEALTTS